MKFESLYKRFFLTWHNDFLKSCDLLSWCPSHNCMEISTSRTQDFPLRLGMSQILIGAGKQNIHSIAMHCRNELCNNPEYFKRSVFFDECMFFFVRSCSQGKLSGLGCRAHARGYESRQSCQSVFWCVMSELKVIGRYFSKNESETRENCKRMRLFFSFLNSDTIIATWFFNGLWLRHIISIILDNILIKTNQTVRLGGADLFHCQHGCHIWQLLTTVRQDIWKTKYAETYQET